jgi:predicted metal-dependent phosphoesterase TrpH
MELSCQHGRAGVHLLAYLLDPGYPPLAAELDKVRDSRANRLPAMIAGLRDVGIDITVDDVARVSTAASSMGRPHIADALVGLGVVRDRDEAFDRYLGWGRPGWVPRYGADLTEMIGHVRQSGGVSVIAHPWGRGSQRTLTADVFADLAAAEQLRSIASDIGLVVTGGSDYHGTGKIDHPLACETTDPEQFERLLAAVP